jgi:multimeric flavodoxin WrbA
MKVLAFNGSPRKESGITGRVLTYFLEGVRQGGADVELICLADKNIGYCRGCMEICLMQTPGVCCQNDDMADILIKLREADMVVYATPVYIDGMTAQMKTLLDRSVATLQGFLEIRDGHLRHPTWDHKRSKMVVVSTCGLSEMDNFDPLLAHFQAVAKQLDMEYIGALLRPAGMVLDTVAQSQPEKIESIYEAMRKAGYEVEAYGKMSPQTLETAAQEIISPKEYAEFANPAIQMLMDTAKKVPQ